ncbi:MAG: sensor histidine kinase [Caulobacteraceae bacterium]
MIPEGATGRWGATSIRVRLGLALALALAPVLILGAVQSARVYQREARDRGVELAGAARRGAATAKARIEAREMLLQPLAPGSIGFQCAPRLAEIRDRIPGYANLIRFDALGRVACAAATVPADPGRRNRPWFRALSQGQAITVTSAPGAGYAAEPALLASVRAHDPDGAFAGVLTAVITLASLRPRSADRALPEGSQVALVDGAGRYLSMTEPAAFPPRLGRRFSAVDGGGMALWLGRDRAGAPRVFSSAPLAGPDVYILLSEPSQGVMAWAWLNPVSAIALPLLAFLLAFAAVGLVAERGVVRWIAYLRRIAAIYAKGRYSVHPSKSEEAAPEIRALARTLDAMAQTIAARDGNLRDALAHKDALMREIHHRVKNNLQVISSLLNMQQRALTDPAARAALHDTRQRIGALALIYRALYQGPDLKRVDLRDFLDELIAQLVMGESTRGAPIRTELHLEPLVIDPDHLAPLALFAVEAITNAKKHGLGEAGGVLGVGFHVRGATAELTVTDSGEAGGAPRVGEGVGRTLMTAFARQLRGEVDFSPNPDGGLTARLTFPNPGADAAAPARGNRLLT